MLQYPVQKISKEEKLRIEESKRVPKWIVDNAEFFSKKAGLYSRDRFEINELFKIASGILDTESYKYVENPFNTTDEKYRKYPAQIRNYDIISPIIDRLMGEREETPLAHIVVASTPDAINDIKLEINNRINAILEEKITARLSNKETQSTKIDVTEIEGDTVLNYNEKKAKHARTALERIKRSQNLAEKTQKAFYNYLVSGRTVSYKDVNHDDVLYEMLRPEDAIGIGYDETSPYMEDCTGIVAYRYMSPNTIVDRWRENLEEKQIEYYLKAGNQQGGYNVPFTKGLETGVDRTALSRGTSGDTHYYMPFDGSITIEHIVWKSLDKRGIVEYQTDFGVEKKEVDANYVFESEKGDISIEWKWENTWWEVWRSIDCYEQIENGSTNDVKQIEYLYWGQGKVQRNEINNTSICKLPYNGFKRGYSYTNDIQSVAKDGKPYQILYNILHYRFELSLAKNMDKVMLFPLGLIPKTKGWNTDKWFYHLRAFSVAFFNESEDRALQALQAIKELDLSLGKYMAEMWQLMYQLRNEWWDRIGFNAQRYGDMNSSDGKATTQNAVYRSSVSTRSLIAQFERWIEKELNGLIDYAKYAFAEGKQGVFINTFGKLEMMDIDPVQFMETEFNTFVVSTYDEKEQLEFIKQMILQPLAQNGTDAKSLIDIVSSKSTAEIKELAKKADVIQKEYQKMIQEQDAATKKYVVDKGLETANINRQTQIEIAQIRADAQIEAALITSDSFNAALGDADANGIDESDEIVQRHFDRTMKLDKANLDFTKYQNQDRLAKQKLDLNNRKLESQERIARINKNKYDKN